MTPLGISILLHYHSCASDYREGDFSAPAVRQLIDEFKTPTDQSGSIFSGMLEMDVGGRDRCYRLSEKGCVYVQALMDLPVPVQVWRMP